MRYIAKIFNIKEKHYDNNRGITTANTRAWYSRKKKRLNKPKKLAATSISGRVLLMNAGEKATNNEEKKAIFEDFVNFFEKI